MAYVCWNRSEIEAIQRRVVYIIHLACFTAYRSTAQSWYILCNNKSMQLTIIPTLSFRSSSIIYYDRIESFGRKYEMSPKQKENNLRLKELAKYSGTVTANAKKRMRKAITLLLQTTQYRSILNRITKRYVSHKISFITLTFPPHSFSSDAKKCHKQLLEPMLRVLRRRYQMKSYIWKCEKQVNGSIHYHLTSDCYIPYKMLMQEWNNILNRNNCLEDFKRTYGHHNPNSVDIKAVRKIKNLEAYLVKYITKEIESNSGINAKVWDCSMNLKAGKYFETAVDNSSQSVINSAVDRKEAQVVKLDKCIIFKFNNQDYLKHFSSWVQSEASKHFKKIRTWTKENVQKSKLTELILPQKLLVGGTTDTETTHSQMKLFEQTIYGELKPSPI